MSGFLSEVVWHRSGFWIPYRLRDNFLSAAELAFYCVVEQAVEQTYSINNKLRLWDVVYVPQGDNRREIIGID